MVRLTALLAAMLVAVCAAGTASGGKPDKGPIPGDDFPDTSCGFTVWVHVDVNREQMKVFDDGRVMINGSFKVTLTHGSKSLSINVSGPATFYPDGTFKGRGAGFGPIAGLDGMLIFGHGLVIQTDDGGPASTHGHFVDLCPLLA